MTLNRFGRDYELFVQIDKDTAIKIQPPLRITFEGVKALDKKLNEFRVNIYNLNREHRNKLVRDAKDKDPHKDKDRPKQTQAEKDADRAGAKIDATATNKVTFRCGYSHLETLFTGNILTAYTERSGADFITHITVQDGLFDFRNSFTSQTVKGDAIEAILSDMKRTKKGKITKKAKGKRPKVLVGNSMQLISGQLFDDEVMFIDNDTLHVIKDGEVLSNIAVDVNSETGMLNSPTKSDKFISASTLMNPAIKLGGLVNLTSIYAPHYNGIYKVEVLKFSGDYDGEDWKMEVLLKAGNYKAVK